VDRLASGRVGTRDRQIRPAIEQVESRLLPSGGRSVKIPASEVGPLTPITQLTGTYNGQTGGLYGNGSNTPPLSQSIALAQADGRIVPRNRQGVPTASGKVGVLAIGQSTTMLEFNMFQLLESQDPQKNRDVAFVNGGQNGMVLQNWASSSGPWRTALGQVKASGITAAQVQVVWIDLAQIYEWRYGDFNSRIGHYAASLEAVIRTAKRDFPNLQIAYVSSRIYGGYGPQGVDPEPYAYESAFGVRLAVQNQIAGDPALNDNPASGKVVAPVVAWGPYFWADGATPRADGFSWQRSDFFPDGVHPAASGQVKAAKILQNFFATDPSARSWFLA
jgi:hypothetical protein